MAEIKRAATINQGQLQRLIKITRGTSRYAERDVLVIMLGHHCGMRITEISRITVADVMHSTGKLKVEFSLREAVTKGCRQRYAYLATKPVIQAVEDYLQYRLQKGVGTVLGKGPYRGLLPNQPLIYSSRGAGMSQNRKRRTLETGEERDYAACDSLQSHVTRLYQKAGLKGSSSHTGRRSFATNIMRSTGDIDAVARFLGHASIDCSQRYLEIDQETLKSMFEEAV